MNITVLFKFRKLHFYTLSSFKDGNELTGSSIKDISSVSINGTDITISNVYRCNITDIGLLNENNTSMITKGVFYFKDNKITYIATITIHSTADLIAITSSLSTIASILNKDSSKDGVINITIDKQMENTSVYKNMEYEFNKVTDFPSKESNEAVLNILRSASTVTPSEDKKEDYLSNLRYITENMISAIPFNLYNSNIQASQIIYYVYKVMSGYPLSPLTGEEDEWETEPICSNPSVNSKSENMYLDYRNKRYAAVLKRVTTDINGNVSISYFNCSGKAFSKANSWWWFDGNSYEQIDSFPYTPSRKCIIVNDDDKGDNNK